MKSKDRLSASGPRAALGEDPSSSELVHRAHSTSAMQNGRLKELKTRLSLPYLPRFNDNYVGEDY